MTKLERVSDIMIRDVKTTSGDSAVVDAARMMTDEGISSVVVVEKGKLAGILTEKDLATKVVALGKTPSKVKVKDVMSSPVLSASPETSILEAAKLLDRKGYKKLPIVSDGKLIGIVTETDLAHALRSKVIEISPATEKGVKPSKSICELSPGMSYLIKEPKSERSFDVFTNCLSHGVPGLVFTRTHPKRVRETYGLKDTPVLWLTNLTSEERSISPYSFSELSILVSKFLKEVDKCVILLDGLEYLITHNSYNQTLKLIQNLRDKVSATNSHLVISVDDRTLSDQQIKLLEQEMDVILSELKTEEEKLESLRDELKGLDR
ncbi:MAG: DUF835 domain-containing protein [Candidatus Altiarchaeota archaeon]